MSEKLFMIFKRLMIVVPLLLLASSQIHILMITKLFVADIGFYLFLFVIMSMLILFNVTSMKGDTLVGMNKFILTCIAAMGSGVIYIIKAWQDYMVQESVMIEDIRLSVASFIVIIIIYFICAIGIFITSNNGRKEKAYA